MESKITIHTGDDFKPVIKVIEKESEDVRDNLITQFRHLLKHTSRTFTIDFLSVPEKEGIKAGYYIIPATDEMEYFKERILDRMTGCLHGLEETEVEIPERVKKVNEFFEWLNQEQGIFG